MSDKKIIQLGAFDLIEPVGKGGMGEVWRGIHRTTGVEVAVKVIDDKRAYIPSFLASFQNEIEAVARLRHPGIIMVFDQGMITEAAEEQSGGHLVAGIPFLAMEYASLGSLERIPHPISWGLMRTLLLATLDALAHAHARGVIHRDIKPENILICGKKDARPGLKITDFGLAHAGLDDRTDSHESVAGTPLYMSPEQCKGLFRDYGPWTDLYALGCIAYELACGRPPFPGDFPLVILTLQLTEEPPPMVPITAIPDGFKEWVARLLQKDPARRFRRAADAAWALAQLPAPEGFEGDLEVEAYDTDLELPIIPPTLILSEGDLDRAPANPRATTEGFGYRRQTASPEWSAAAQDALMSGRYSLSHWLDEEIESSSTGTPLGTMKLDADVPPVPEAWGLADYHDTSLRLTGAGLGLFGLRSIPFINRDTERSQLWQSLRRAAEERTCRAVLLAGSAGVGKTRLMGWLAERTHELGSAIVLQANHSPNGGWANGIPTMLSQHFRCQGLARPELLERTRDLLRRRGVDDEYEWTALAEIMSSGALDRSGVSAPFVRFGQPSERFVVVRRMLSRLAHERALLICLDDVHWGAESLAFVEYLLLGQMLAPLPCLIVMTAREEVLAEQPLEAEGLSRVFDLPNTSRLSLGPLAEQHRPALVHAVLGLEPHLTEAVAHRTDGNPLFAVQLIGDWVERDVLEVGDEGFVLRPGESAPIPDNVHGLWEERMNRLGRQCVTAGEAEDVEDAKRALTIAAALGPFVDAAEWRMACMRANCAIPNGLVYRIVTSNLAYSTALGWAFTNGMLRESLKRRAQDEGLWRGYQAICAEALRACYPDEQLGLAERAGRHYLEAEFFQNAFAALMRATRERLERSDFEVAHQLLDGAETSLSRLAVAASDRRSCEVWLLRATIDSRRETRLDMAYTGAEAVVTLATGSGFHDLAAEATWLVGYVQTRRGKLDLATRSLETARHQLQALGDGPGAVKCINQLAAIARRTGKPGEAMALLKQARSLAELYHDHAGLAGSLLGLSQLTRSAGDLNTAEVLAQRALSIFERQHNQIGIGAALNDLAESARQREDYAAAEAGYRGALARYVAVGSGRMLFPRLNLSLILLSHERYSEARQELAPLVPFCQASGQTLLLGSVHCLLLPCVAAEGDWDAWDLHLKQATALVFEAKSAERDDAWALEQAGKIALEAGQLLRAAGALELSKRQWRRLDRHDRVDAIEALMGSMQ